MPDGSLFVLGPRTNLEWQHSVPKQKNKIGPSISLVFRQVATFKRSDGHIYGYGAKFKTEEELNKALSTEKLVKTMTDEELHLAMVKGYALENKYTKNNHDDYYKNIIENTF